MASEKQIQANKLNAQKSTGPKTAEGKAKVSQNAVTHGLTAASPVLNNENPQQYNLFHENLTRQLAPEGVLEYFFAERAANLSWRLNRAQRYDTLFLNTMLSEDSPNAGSHSERSEESLCTSQSMQDVPKIENDPDSHLNNIITSDFHNRRTLEKIQRYESRIERSFFRTLKELRQLQSCRLNNVGQASPLDNSVGEASVLHNQSVNSKNEKNKPKIERSEIPTVRRDKSNSDSLGSCLLSLDSFAQNKANFPLDIITQIENKRLRSRLIDKKAV